MTGRPDQVDVAATKSSPVDVVTERDLASEALLRSLLASTGPTTASSARRTSRSRGRPGSPGSSTRSTARSTTSTASRRTRSRSRWWPAPPVPERWTAVAGAVHSVVRRPDVHRRPRAAAPGSTGARCAATPARPLAESLVGTGFAYTVQRRTEQGQLLAALLPADPRRAPDRVGGARPVHRSPPAASTCTTSAGSSPGTSPRGAGRGGVRRGGHRAARRAGGRGDDRRRAARQRRAARRVPRGARGGVRRLTGAAVPAAGPRRDRTPSGQRRAAPHAPPGRRATRRPAGGDRRPRQRFVRARGKCGTIRSAPGGTNQCARALSPYLTTARTTRHGV